MPISETLRADAFAMEGLIVTAGLRPLAPSAEPLEADALDMILRAGPR
jgi:hypothetical protein